MLLHPVYCRAWGQMDRSECRPLKRKRLPLSQSRDAVTNQLLTVRQQGQALVCEGLEEDKEEEEQVEEATVGRVDAALSILACIVTLERRAKKASLFLWIHK